MLKKSENSIERKEKTDWIGFILGSLVAASWAVAIGLILSKVLLE